MRPKNTNNTNNTNTPAVIMKAECQVSEETEITSTNDCILSVQEFKICFKDSSVYALVLRLSKKKERRTKEFKINIEQTEKINTYISEALNLKIKDLALWCGTVSYDNINGVKIAYDRGHAKYDEIIKYLEQYIFENYPVLIEELKK